MKVHLVLFLFILAGCSGSDNDCMDRDGDGYGHGSGCLGVDCNDSDPNVHPGISEVPYDGLDNDCDLETPDDDVDEDGYLQAEDCDDTNSAINPGVAEVYYDGIDNDCDPDTIDDDQDADGHTVDTDCDDTDQSVHPGTAEIVYDGKDNDCNPATLDDDLDLDGYELARDCDDTDAAINPGVDEIYYNGIDDDCDPATVDDDQDSDGDPVASDCDDTNPEISSQILESHNDAYCADELDNDCDGDTDCADPDCTAVHSCVFTVDDREDFDDPELQVSLFFSPVDGMQEMILEELSRASTSIHLAFFNIRLQEVADILLEKTSAGLDVHVIMDQRQMDQIYNELDDWMTDAGILVEGVLNESATESTMHNKFTIIDGHRVLTGSLNYSTTAFNRSEEELLLIDDPDIAAIYETEFQELLTGGEESHQQDPGAPVQVFFGPEDHQHQVTVDAIDGAQDSVQVLMFSLGLSNLTDAMIAAHDRAVNVVIGVDDRQSEENEMDDDLETAGVPVLRIDRSFPVELHNKLCVIDGQLVLAGSYNWTPLASFHNDENYVRIESPALATRAESRVAELFAQEDPAFDPATYGWTSGTRSVTFQVTNLEVPEPAAVYIMGDVPELGDMDPARAVLMTRQEMWSATVVLDAGATVAYLYLVKAADGQVHLEGEDPRSVTISYTGAEKFIYDTFRQ